MIQNFPFKIVLGSKSPRRKQLLEDIGLQFELRTIEVDENYSPELKGEEVALFLSELKAKAFLGKLADDELVITSDTIVCMDDIVLGKPSNAREAFEALSQLSGRSHEVITGVCFLYQDTLHSFSETTEVHFRELADEEIQHYIENHNPFDKAGSYGIQDWIGKIGVEFIKGSYYNVVGLPVVKLYSELKKMVINEQ